jgi:hypothetical protein
LRFAAKRSRSDVSVSEKRGQRFDGDRTIQPFVSRAIDDPHPAAAISPSMIKVPIRAPGASGVESWVSFRGHRWPGRIEEAVGSTVRRQELGDVAEQIGIASVLMRTNASRSAAAIPLLRRTAR